MINKRKILRLIIVIIGVFILSLTFMIAKAQVGLAVSVKPILPKNQHNSEATYYDLRMIPAQKQDLQMELTNTSDKEQNVTLEINNATTNDNGDIDYSNRSKTVPRDKSLGVSFKDIATIEKEITVPAEKTVITTICLEIPEKQFDRMILGGIKVVSSEKDSETHDSTNKETQPKKTYIVAVKLTETDRPSVVKLNLLDIVFSKESNRNVIRATIQNGQAVNIEDIDFTVDVYKIFS